MKDYQRFGNPTMEVRSKYIYLKLTKYECMRETMNFIWTGTKTTMVIVPSLYNISDTNLAKQCKIFTFQSFRDERYLWKHIVLGY